MDDDQTQLIEQIERCRRLAGLLTDERMRQALEELAKDYEARLKHNRKNLQPFMLRNPT